MRLRRFVVLGGITAAMGLVAVGCGKQENGSEQATLTAEAAVQETVSDDAGDDGKNEPADKSEKETYWERTEDLGLPKESDVRLQSNSGHSGLKMIIDSCEMELQDEGILCFNYNFTKMRTKDLDGDGVKEIVLLFYGGASGTFQNFRVIKYDGQKWAVVPMEWDGWKDDSFVDVKALKNCSVKISVPKTGYDKTVKLPENEYLKKEGEQAAVGVGYRLFKWSDRGIEVSEQLYANNVGDTFGEVRQNIRWNEDGTRLVLGKTSYRQK